MVRRCAARNLGIPETTSVLAVIRAVVETGPKRRSQRNRLESATPTAPALPHLKRSWQGETESHHRGGTRVAGLYLGHRSSGGTKQQTSRINKKQNILEGKTKSKNHGR